MNDRAQKPLLSLQQISKTFSNGTVALSNLSLDVEQGSFISLLGPLGYGKSTILQIIAGLTLQTSGQLDWPSSTDYHQPESDISFVFQEPTLLPWATVYENIWLPLRLQGISRRTARYRVKDALSMVDLLSFSNAYPRELSGGMQMRVSIARALITRPKLLLMDEPFAALDEMTRFKLNNDLLKLWGASNWTVIFVTHSVFESVFLSSRIFLISARPGQMVGDIKIDSPYPRTEEFRTSASYNSYCRTTYQALTKIIS